jgi:hypothetical protein
MTSMGNLSDGSPSQSRREALKKFGRYAAVAPTVMVLLEPRESHARKGKGSGRGWGKGRKGRKGGGNDY